MIKPRSFPDYYRRLSVHKGMGETQIHEATRHLLMRAHPDRGGDASRFALLTQARSALSNEEERRHYHEQLALLAPWCLTCDAEGFRMQQAGFVRRKVTACPECGGSGFLLQDTEWDNLEIRQ